MQSLAKRIDALEQSNRCLRVGVGVCVTLLVGMLILAADEPTQSQSTQTHAVTHDTLRARKIEIVDDNEKAAITLSIGEGLGAVVSLTGPSGGVTLITGTSIWTQSRGGSVMILSGDSPGISIMRSSGGSMSIGDDGIFMFDEELFLSEVVTRPMVPPRLQRRLDRQDAIAKIKEALKESVKDQE